MTTARRFYRVQVVVAALGLLAAALSLVAVVRILEFSPPPASVLLSACRELLIPHTAGELLAVLPLAALAAAVLVVGTRSLQKQVRASRRYLATLETVETETYGGAPLVVFRGSRAQAFCAGLVHPRIYVSTAATELPSARLEPVLAHELHHHYRRDPLRIALARAVAAGLFFVPVLRRSAERYSALAEIAADEAAARLHGRRALASSLLAFGQAGSPAAVVGIAPERVDQLLGTRAPRWELPAALFAISIVGIAAIITAALIAPAHAGGAGVNVPLLLAQSCMLAMVAVPALLAAAGLFLARIPRRARAS